jgi:hypothetical protein
MTGGPLPVGADADGRLQATRRRLRRYATLLDSGIGVPGTRWQIGIEALIGLIPGVGDLAGALLGGWFVVEALRLRAPGRLVAKMIGNIVFDVLLGVVPLLGDVADFVFKSNRRNLDLLDAHLDARLGVAPPAAPRRSRWLLWLALAVVGGYLLWRFAGTAV